jgi:hypothetical protein
MDEVTFAALVAALAHPRMTLDERARFVIPPIPNPFVPPILRAPHNPDLLKSEVVYIQASAAVGKSTIAAALCAEANIPLLDLAIVPASTGTLKALVSGLPLSNPIRAFHHAEVPVVIDALDEGRLLSGEAGFESFLQTTAEFLMEDRAVTDKPKLIFLGRYESIDLAWLGVGRS